VLSQTHRAHVVSLDCGFGHLMWPNASVENFKSVCAQAVGCAVMCRGRRKPKRPCKLPCPELKRLVGHTVIDGCSGALGKINTTCIAATCCAHPSCTCAELLHANGINTGLHFTQLHACKLIYAALGGGDSRHFGPMCLLFRMMQGVFYCLHSFSFLFYAALARTCTQLLHVDTRQD
jgi:hypothetical protein